MKNFKIIWIIRIVAFVIFMISLVTMATNVYSIKNTSPILYQVTYMSDCISAPRSNPGIKVLYNNEEYHVGIQSRTCNEIKKGNKPKLYFNKYLNKVVSETKVNYTLPVILFVLFLFFLFVSPQRKNSI